MRNIKLENTSFCLNARKWSFIICLWLEKPDEEAPPVRIVTKSIGKYKVCILLTNINLSKFSKSAATLYDKSNVP